MKINQHFSNNVSTTFGISSKGLKISKNTKKMMYIRGELDAFDAFRPELERLSKKANITVYGNSNNYNTAYGISIKEKNTLLNNPITRGFGLFKKRKQGDSFITINNNLAQENVFRDLYDSAHKAFKFGNKGLY